MSFPAEFECFHCNEAIPEDEMRERIQNPPGACKMCGSPVVLEVRDGALGLLAAELGVKVGHIEVKR